MSNVVDLTPYGYKIGEKGFLGRGHFAEAHVAIREEDGREFVAKVVSLECLNDNDQKLAHQEVKLLQRLRHEYIVSFEQSYMLQNNNLVILMEYCQHGELRKEIKALSGGQGKPADYLKELQIMTWFTQLTLALNYMHAVKVLHRDLKSSNIFVTYKDHQTGEYGPVKLGDFGISRVLEGTIDAAVTVVGTPYYMSPEICRSEPYSYSSDVWALGCVLYEMCMLKHAFESESLVGLVYKIVSDCYDDIDGRIYSQQLANLIRELLDKSAGSRPSTGDILLKTYVQSYVTNEMRAKQSQQIGQARETTWEPGDVLTEEEDYANNLEFLQPRQDFGGEHSISRTVESPSPPALMPPGGSPQQRASSPSQSSKIQPVDEHQEQQAVVHYQPPKSPYSPGRPSGGRQAWDAPPPPPAQNQYGDPSQNQHGDMIRMSNDNLGEPGSPTRRRTIAKVDGLMDKFLIARVRRNLVKRKINWQAHFSQFAEFDQEGMGQMTFDSFYNSMTSVNLGLSECEIGSLFEQADKNYSSDGRMSLQEFNKMLQTVNHETIQLCESAVKSILMGLSIRAMDNNAQTNKYPNRDGVSWLRHSVERVSGRAGVIHEEQMHDAVKTVDPNIREGDIAKIRLWATKNVHGYIDLYDLLGNLERGSAATAAAPQPPQPATAFGPSPSMPHQNRSVMPSTPAMHRAPMTPAGAPPLPPLAFGAPSFDSPASYSRGMRRDDGDEVRILLDRMRHRCKMRNVHLEHVLSLFCRKQAITRQEIDTQICQLPLGLSRAEWQVIAAFLDNGGKFHFPLKDLCREVHNTKPLDFDVDHIITEQVFEQLKETFSNNQITQKQKHNTVIKERDFRSTVMRASKYLTPDQIKQLVLMADKDAEGGIFYKEFLLRVNSEASVKLPPARPGKFAAPPRWEVRSE